MIFLWLYHSVEYLLSKVILPWLLLFLLLFIFEANFCDASPFWSVQVTFSTHKVFDKASQFISFSFFYKNSSLQALVQKYFSLWQKQNKITWYNPSSHLIPPDCQLVNSEVMSIPSASWSRSGDKLIKGKISNCSFLKLSGCESAVTTADDSGDNVVDDNDNNSSSPGWWTWVLICIVQ